MKTWLWIMVGCVLISEPQLARPQASGSQQQASQGQDAGQAHPHKSGWLCLHNCASNKIKEYDLKDRNYSGEIVGGPKTIVLRNLNALRYKYSVNSNVSFSQPPDLFSKLTGVASPQQPSAATTAPATKKTPDKASLPGAPARAQLSQPGGPKALVKAAQPPGKRQPKSSALPISQETLDLVDKANAVMGDGISEIEQVRQHILGVDQTLINAVNGDFDAISGEAKKASTSTTDVANAGQELISFLKAADATNTYEGVQRELSSTSEFTKGVNSQWANAATIGAVKNSSSARKAIVAAKKTAFDSQYPALLKSLGAAQHDLVTARESLQLQKSKLQASPRSSTEDKLVIDTIAAINLVLNGGSDTSGNNVDGVNTAAENLQHANDTLNWVTATTASIETTLADLDTTGDKYKAFQQAQTMLLDWQQKMLSLKQSWENHLRGSTDDPFVLRIPATCDYTFSTTKQTVVKVTASDQIPDKSAASPSDVLSVTIECASPFTISAGVAFSTISDHQFSIQPVATPPGSTTTTNEFVLTSNSSFHPLPIGLVSARVCEPNEKVSLHLSFGLAGDFKSQNSGGSGAEFLIGPSIALFRTMFLTPGLHLGQQVTLGAGFKVGDPVPANVTSPPLRKSYTPAFGFAITFTKP